MLKFAIIQNVRKDIQILNNQTLEVLRNASARFQERIKGTVLENWVRYWKNVFIDYKAVAIDIKQDIKEKPIKAICIFSFLGSLIYFAKNNPDEIHFRDACISASNKLMLVHTSMQNKESVQYLKTVESYHNQKKLKRLNAGIASFIWTNYYSNSCHNYEADCPYLQVKYRGLKHQILDVGFLNRWWILNNKMEDYDVNY